MDIADAVPAQMRGRGRLYSRFAGEGTAGAPSVFRDIFQQPMYGRAVSQRLYNSTKGMYVGVCLNKHPQTI